MIPAELVDSIIEQLSDDKNTLMKSSLVSKTWVPACRYRLFFPQLITLEPEHWDILRNSDMLHVYARAVNLTCHHSPKESNTVEELEEILHPLLGLFLIKLPRLVLRLLLGPPDIRITKAQFNAELMQFTFPRITILVVALGFTGDQGWHKPEEPHSDHVLLEKLSTIFPRVTTLDLLDSFRTFHETLQFVCSFPELETLAINFDTWHDININVQKFRLPAGLKIVRCLGRLTEVMYFIDWLSVMEPTPRLVALTFTLFRWRQTRSLSRLLSKIGKTLQHLRLTPCPGSLSSDLLSVSTLTPYLGHWWCFPDHPERHLLYMHVVTEANTALRYLDLRFENPYHYIHHLPAYIRNTQVEEVMIMVAFRDGSDVRDESEISGWLTLDKMIVESLAARPRENFSLCLYIPFSTAPTSAEDCARNVFPRCSALGLLSFVHFDDVERANQTTTMGPLFIGPQENAS